MAEEPTAEVRLTIEDGFTEGYLHGFMAAFFGHGGDDPEFEPCEDCECGVNTVTGEPRDLEMVSAPAALDFQKQVRDYLERYDLVTDDDLVTQVVVCPEEVRAFIERE